LRLRSFRQLPIYVFEIARELAPLTFCKLEIISLTSQTQNVVNAAVSRPLREAGAPEIEITPAMIAAGVSAFLDYDSRFEGEAEAVADIYRAMVTVGRRPSTES
jgi:hypothetical protein